MDAMTARKPDFYRVAYGKGEQRRWLSGFSYGHERGVPEFSHDPKAAGRAKVFLFECEAKDALKKAQAHIAYGGRIVPVYVKVTRKPKLSETTKGTNMQATGIETIEVNGVKYIKEGAQVAPPKPGKRAVVVVDRGWIFAGDVTREGGRIKLSRAVHVLSWESVGFAGLIEDVKAAKAKLKPVADVDMPEGAEIFCVPVGDSWGL